MKILIYAVLVYFAYRLFMPKSLQSGDKDKISHKEEDDYTEYEEID